MSDLNPVSTASEAAPETLPVPEPAPAVPSPAHKALWREVVETILLTVLIYVGVNLTVGRFRIESVSMMPNLQPGEYVMVDKVSYHFVTPQRGDIVVFHHPLGERDLIKRIIGLPGETIEITNGMVNINGQPIDEPYIAAPPGGGGTWTLSPTQLFVMGDNRNNSSDSRAWGPLERDLVIGRTIFIYWPPGNWGLVPHYTYAASE